MYSTNENVSIEVSITPKLMKRERTLLEKLFHVFLEKEERKVRIRESFLDGLKEVSLEELAKTLKGIFRKVITIKI